MRVLKGFVTIFEYEDPKPRSISPAGELSLFSKTFAKDISTYASPNNSGYRLHAFRYIDDQTGAEMEVPGAFATSVIDVIASIDQYAKNNSRPYDNEDFKSYIITNFDTRIYNFTMGRWVDNGYVALPEWVSWETSDNGGTTVKLWMADESFRAQYDDTEIVVVPIVDDVDAFFGSYNSIATLASSVSNAELTTRIEKTKGEYPYTYVRTSEFDFVNLANPDLTTQVPFTVLVYGPAGDHLDARKEAIVKYLLANSSRTQADWELIFPDLFRRTEVVLLPRWDKIAVENIGSLVTSYSSMMTPQECVEFAQQAITFYPADHVGVNVTVFPTTYKFVNVVAVNGMNNKAGKESIAAQYSDYMPISLDLLDSSRMSVITRNWVDKLVEALIAAETATAYSTIPQGLFRVIRNDIVFISFVEDGVNNLVAARSNIFYES